MQIITTSVPTLPTQLSVNPDLEEERNNLALEARGIVAINTPELNERAGMAARSIRQHIKLVEENRKQFTKPLRDLAELSKAVMDDHLRPLQDELARLEQQAAGWLASERQRVAHEQEQQRLAYQKAEQERQEAERKAQSAVARAKTDAGMDLAVKAVDKANAAILNVQDVLATPRPVVSKVNGQSSKKVLRYEVLDIRQVYAARPELCSLEIKPSAVQATCFPEMPVPGLRLWMEDKVTFSSR